MAEFALGRALQALPKVQLRYARDVGGARQGGFRMRTGEQESPPFWANVQPSTPQQMQMIEGGEEVHAALTIYTAQELFTTRPTGEEADRLRDSNGNRYKVVKAFDWSGQGLRVYIVGTEAA